MFGVKVGTNRDQQRGWCGQFDELARSIDEVRGPGAAIGGFEPLAKEPPHEIVVRLGQNVHQFRRRANMTQPESSAAAGLHKVAVGRMERGDRVARVDTRLALAKPLLCGSAELLEGLEEDVGL